MQTELRRWLEENKLDPKSKVAIRKDDGQTDGTNMQREEKSQQNVSEAITCMHQSYVSPAPLGPENSGTFNFFNF